MSKKIHFKLEEIDSSNINQVQIIRAGKFNHPYYGRFDIDQKVLRQFKANFDDKVRRIDLAVDYFHNSCEQAAGWIKSIELKEDDTQLWATIEWTKEAENKITDKQIRYLSAEFQLKYQDSETTKEYGPTLLGAGLTNRPHVKGMSPILDESTNPNIKELNEMPTFDEITKGLQNLSEDEKLQIAEKIGLDLKDLADAKKQLSEGNIALTELKAENTKLSDSINEIQNKLVLAEKETSFTKMLANGKVVEAQRVAFMEGDFAKFAEGAIALNLKGQGVEGNNTNLSDDDLMSKFDKLVKKEQDENANISFSDAVKAVKIKNTEFQGL